MIRSDVHGGDSAIIGIRAVNAEIRSQIVELVQEAAKEAETAMLARVPRGKDKGVEEDTIAGSIGTSAVRYHPGGAGGGGTWEVEVGPGERSPAPSHLRFVLEGTGIYGPMGNLITSHGGGPMVFSKGGEGVIFRESAQGQRPQTGWLEESQQVARDAIAIGVQRIRIKV